MGVQSVAGHSDSLSWRYAMPECPARYQVHLGKLRNAKKIA
jgi:hypothetical protein